MIHSALAIALVVLALPACSATNATAHRDRNTLVVLEQADGATMNPLFAQSQTDSDVYPSMLYDSLAVAGVGFAMVPDLATTWTPSADGLHWNVTLRRGVRWSDGAPFTSKDVAFTYRIMIDPKTGYVGASALEAVRSVTATGPYSVRFDLGHVTALFAVGVLSEPMLPEHILGAVPAAQQLGTSFGEHPIGTGPYVLAHWQHDSEAVFARNPTYWAGPAKIGRVDFRIIFNPQSMVDAVENGSADLIDQLGYSQALRLTREAPQIKQLRVPALEVGVIEPNLHRPGLDDVMVRRAMMYGHDRQAIIDGFLGGQGSLATSWVPEALVAWYDPKVTRYPYDPARARRLLDAGGWISGPGGIRHKGATTLSFTMLVNQGSTIVLDEVLEFAADMKAVGIKVDVRLLDFPSIIQRVYTGKYDMIFDERGGSVDPDASFLFLSTMTPPAGGNTVGYDDPEADRLMQAGIRELSVPKRRLIYDRLQQRLAQTLPMLWDVNANGRVAYSSRLVLDPKTTLPFPLIWYNVADWTLSP
jgi:peptide/nickel transport system substrate-binding protein